MKVAIVGLSLSSSWGNGHATTYRSLVNAFRERGHETLFFEREEPWYAAHRDLPEDDALHFYATTSQLLDERKDALHGADLVILGSYVRGTSAIVRALKGSAQGRRMQGLLAFYDIDTPVTIAALRDDRCEYLERSLIPQFDLYLSFSGGAVLDELRALGARRPRPLYCSADPQLHAPVALEPNVDLGYLGTYSPDRHPVLTELLLEPARSWRAGRFTVGGAQYPDARTWPGNVSHVAHLPPGEHATFYCSQRFTLNVTRADMRRMGHSPSVRLFEAACCGTPVISDSWNGIDAFFEPGEEILLAGTRADVLRYVRGMPEDERAALAAAARQRVLAEHTGERRIAELESYVAECR